MNSKPLFVVWSSFSPRAETLAAELHGEVSFQYETGLAGGGYWLKPVRWLLQGWKTWQVLEKKRPDLVLVQAPPVFAPLVVSMWCIRQGYVRSSGHRARYIIDGHTGTFHYPTWMWSLPLFRLLARKAIATLVTDRAALGLLKRWHARGIFLIDGIPSLSSPVGTIGSLGENRVAVISTLSNSEPVEEVFAAARLLPQVAFYLTGDTTRLPSVLFKQKPTNIILTNFLRGGSYTALLKNVHGLVILTRQSNDLSCGAFEALAVEKPAVVSKGPEMLRFFTQGFIHVDNTPEAIASGIEQMLDRLMELTKEVVVTRSKLISGRAAIFEELKALL
ncbi:MAG: hypothetical protein ACXWPG_13850 [Ktedonobacteraceae bacterium]